MANDENGRGRRPFTEEERERFLNLIADGKTRQEAAETLRDEFPEAYSTATRWRGLTIRDPVFAERYAQALEASGNPDSPLFKRIQGLERAHLLQRMFDEYIARALDPKKGASGSSNRALQNLLTLMHTEFKPFLEARMHRHIHSGAVGIFSMPQIDTGKWSIEEHEEFVAINARRDALLAKAMPDDSKHPLELAAVASDAETIDAAEFEELPAE